MNHAHIQRRDSYHEYRNLDNKSLNGEIMKTENSIQPTQNDLSQLFNAEEDLKKSALAYYPLLFRGDLWETFMHISINKFCSIESVSLKEFLEDFEKRLIIGVLSRVNGSRKNAAGLLGIKYTTLHEKLKKYNIHFRNMVY